MHYIGISKSAMSVDIRSEAITSRALRVGISMNATEGLLIAVVQILRRNAAQNNSYI